ncbi:MAG TPA: sulfatase [Sandaracinaceae bacterium LLY-WYZ-13_1]|nr:sulfatase [Sandaracinaceae bacterium LLY-WYZ-13_1]
MSAWGDDSTTRDAAMGAGVLLLFAVVIGVARWEGDRPPRPPNLVVIVIDTLRADALSSYGHPEATSPELDALARRGVRFDDVLSNASWTRPSFASMLTSLSPRASGIRAERMHVLPEAFVTMPEVLDEAGYVTLGVTANPNINTTFQFDQGFDAYVDSGVRWRWMREEAQEGDLVHGEAPLMPAPEAFERALSLLETHASGEDPVYLQIDVMDVHERGDRRVIDERWWSSFEGHPDDTYLSAVRQVSAEIGAFIEALEARPELRGDTWYVITSDHGEGLRSHPHVRRGRDHGFHVYASQVEVPLIVYRPSRPIEGGRVVEAPVQLLDLMPTLLALARAEGPSVMEGRSLVPLMRGEAVDLPERRVVETWFRGAHAIGVYDDAWAYIEHRRPWDGTNPEELQARGRPMDGARTDRREAHPDVAAELDAHLEAWEEAHPAARPTRMGHAIPAHERAQLRALGYIE